MVEKWSPIPNYENYYAVSDFGRIRSLKRVIVYKSGSIRTINEKILSFDVARGYHRVTLSKEGVNKRFMVHRLVADVFIPNKEGKTTVNHIDSNRTNNHVSNLEWVSVIENIHHGYSTRKMRSSFVGVYADKNKWRANITIDGKRINIGTYDTEEDAARAYIEMSNKYGIVNKYLQNV